MSGLNRHGVGRLGGLVLWQADQLCSGRMLVNTPQKIARERPGVQHTSGTGLITAGLRRRLRTPAAPEPRTLVRG
ncbi:MAG: hypothetical protein ACUVQR_12980, partial [Thermogutta sp.]